MNTSVKQEQCFEAGLDSVHTHIHAPAEVTKINNRISRIIGHLESIKRMVSSGRDCNEILIQLCAVRSAVNSVSRRILNEHLEVCIQDSIKAGDTEAVDEFLKVINMLMK